MKWYEQSRPAYRQKKYLIPLFILAFLVVLRIILTPVLLSFINSKLKDRETSPTLIGHVDDLSLGFIRGHVVLSGITASIRESEKRFLKVGAVDAGISWASLFKGDLVADVVIDNVDVTYSDQLMKALKAHAADAKKDDDEEDDKDKKGEGPIRIARVDLRNAQVRLEPHNTTAGKGVKVKDLTPKDNVIMEDIDARITNATPTKDAPKTLVAVQGKVMNSGDFKSVAEAKLLEEPLQWTMDSELLRFDLSTLNRFLLNKVPLSFTHGQLDLYAEAKSDNGKTIQGYIKPFVKGLDVVKKKEDFKGTKHFLVEIISALGHITFDADRTESIGTRVPFVFDGELKAASGEAFRQAFEHGFQQEISRGIENSINLK